MRRDMLTHGFRHSDKRFERVRDQVRGQVLDQVARRPRVGKSLVAWSAAAQRSSSVPRPRASVTGFATSSLLRACEAI